MNKFELTTSLFDFLIFHDFLYLPKFYEFLYTLEGHSSLLFYLFVVMHLVHVVGRYWARNFFVLLIIPNLSVLVEKPFVDLIKKSEDSGFIRFFTFFSMVFDVFI